MKGFEPGRSVVDLGNLLTVVQEKELESAITMLDRDTRYRFRVLSPPLGRGSENPEEWISVVKAVREYWATSPNFDADNLVVFLAKSRVRFSSPMSRNGLSRPGNTLSFSVSKKLKEDPVYSDTFSQIANKFGGFDYIGKAGEDGSTMAAAINAIACLRQNMCLQPLSEAEAKNLAFGKPRFVR